MSRDGYGAAELKEFVARAEGLMGRSLLRIGRLEEAERELNHALAVAREVGTRPTQMEMLFSIAELHEARGDFAAALRITREAMDLREEIHGQEMKTRMKNMQINLQVAAAEKEAEVTERLLLNMLPEPIAYELKMNGRAKPVHYDAVTVLFTDFVGFTRIAENMQPSELVAELDSCFTEFDAVIRGLGLEKLKTIGDAYMAASGVPVEHEHHALLTVRAGLEIREVMRRRRQAKEAAGLPYWDVRIGLHSGPLVAGVIGREKFAYDVWGDTVNTASRMESGGEPDRVNLSGATYELVKDLFECQHRGRVTVKGKGALDMYFVERIKSDYASDAAGLVPNERFPARGPRVATMAV